MTVRQLESMIRLAEAMAKMECSDEVKVKHVQEAYRLLNKSIIRVEQPDIMLDENEDEPELENGDNQDVDMEADNPPSPGPPPEVPVKPKAKITFEEYNKICYMITHHIRKIEEESDTSEGKRNFFSCFQNIIFNDFFFSLQKKVKV